MAAYKWGKNLACIATYKVLEGDDNLDQFEASDISFDDAEEVTMGDLRFYPKTTTNSDIIELISFEFARKFLKGIVKGYVVSKEDSETKSSEIIVLLAAIFRNKNATIKSLAEKADSLIRFSDE